MRSRVCFFQGASRETPLVSGRSRRTKTSGGNVPRVSNLPDPLEKRAETNAMWPGTRVPAVVLFLAQPGVVRYFLLVLCQVHAKNSHLFGTCANKGYWYTATLAKNRNDNSCDASVCSHDGCKHLSEDLASFQSYIHLIHFDSLRRLQRGALHKAGFSMVFWFSTGKPPEFPSGPLREATDFKDAKSRSELLLPVQSGNACLST